LLTLLCVFSDITNIDHPKPEILGCVRQIEFWHFLF